MKIFLSYRRDDTQHSTGRLYERLVQAFGRKNVFKDVDSIPHHEMPDVPTTVSAPSASSEDGIDKKDAP